MKQDEKRTSKLATVLGASTGMILLAVGVWGLTQRHMATTGRPATPSTASTEASSTDTPDEKKPATDQIAVYTVPAEQPRMITISSGITGLVQKVGTTKDNAVGTPSNVNFAGWYTASVLPGQKGLSIIDGHVSGKYNDGIFKHLAGVKVNDVVQVEFGDMSVKKFSVVEVKSVPEADSAALLFAKRPELDAQLNLITCGGKFDRAKQLYEDRVIVVASRIK